MNTPKLPSMLGQMVNGMQITSEMFTMEDGSPIVFRFSGGQMVQRDCIAEPAPIKKTGPGHFNPYPGLTDAVKKQLNGYMRGGSCFQVALGACLDFCPTYIMEKCDEYGMICPKGFSKDYWRGRGIRPWTGTKDPSVDFMNDVCYKTHEDGTRRNATRIRIDQRTSTLNRLAKAYPTGRYFVGVDGHCLAIIDGDIYDHTFKKGRRVEWAWRIDPVA